MKWVKVEDNQPPLFERILVVKHYVNNEFCFKSGGYKGKPFITSPFIEEDIQFHKGYWEKGGIVTKWLRKDKVKN
jgi:hypothetical protein